MRRAVRIAGGVLLGLALTVGACVTAVEVRHGRARDAPTPRVQVSTAPDVLARGEYLVHGPGACAMCHASQEDATRTTPGKRPSLRGGYVFSMPGFGTFRPSNLTPDDETGLGRRTPEQIARTIRHGVGADGSLAPFMAIHASGMADDDLAAVVSYLLSTEPVAHDAGTDELSFPAKAMVAFVFEPAHPDTRAVAPVAAATVERGEYLANDVALCAFCHTEHDPLTMEATTPKLSGGTPNPSVEDPDTVFTAPNLTPWSGGALARFDEDAFVARFRAGKLTPSSPMPWQALGNMTDDDVRAIYRYLQTLPPTAKDTGPSARAKDGADDA